MIQTSIPEGFEVLNPILGVGGREGSLLRSSDGAMAVGTFIPVEPRSQELRLIFQAFEMASQLAHPRILNPLALRKVEGGLLLLSPWVNGPSLRDVLDARIQSDRALDLKTILRIFRPVCAALNYGHRDATDVDGDRLHMPHGWIRPETLVIAAGGQVAIRDYWIGWVLARLHGGIPSPYTSPQIVRGEPPSAQGDLFAVGSVLFELATLSPLLADAPPAALRRQLVEAKYRRKFDRLAPRDPGLSAIIRRCLAPVGAQRYKDMQSLVTDLLRLSRGEVPLAGDTSRNTAPASTQETAPALGEFGPETLAPKSEEAYDVRATEVMNWPPPPEQVSEEAPWNGASEVGEDVAQWFSESKEEPASQLPLPTERLEDSEEGSQSEPLDHDLEEAVRPPKLRRFLMGLALIVAVGLGIYFGPQTLGPAEGFRVQRMESRLGVEGVGDLEARLVFLEALAGRQRIGDDLAFRAEHLQTEMSQVVLAASVDILAMEHYYGIESSTTEPIYPRLGRLEELTFGAMRVRANANARPYSLVSRRAGLEDALKGRLKKESE